MARASLSACFIEINGGKKLEVEFPSEDSVKACQLTQRLQAVLLDKPEKNPNVIGVVNINSHDDKISEETINFLRAAAKLPGKEGDEIAKALKALLANSFLVGWQHKGDQHVICAEDLPKKFSQRKKKLRKYFEVEFGGLVFEFPEVGASIVSVALSAEPSKRIYVGQMVKTKEDSVGGTAGTVGIVHKIVKPAQAGRTSDVIDVHFEGQSITRRMKFYELGPS